MAKEYAAQHITQHYNLKIYLSYPHFFINFAPLPKIVKFLSLGNERI